MGDVTGPISTLPGAGHPLPPGAMCDDHPDRPAVARIQGETDSFGAELLDLCQECLDELRAHRAEARCGMCDWCRAEATDLRPKRDVDEGLAGRVYHVCGLCDSRYEARLREELERYDTDTRSLIQRLMRKNSKEGLASAMEKVWRAHHDCTDPQTKRKLEEILNAVLW